MQSLQPAQLAPQPQAWPAGQVSPAPQGVAQVALSGAVKAHTELGGHAMTSQAFATAGAQAPTQAIAVWKLFAFP